MTGESKYLTMYLLDEPDNDRPSLEMLLDIAARSVCSIQGLLGTQRFIFLPS